VIPPAASRTDPLRAVGFLLALGLCVASSACRGARVAPSSAPVEPAHPVALAEARIAEAEVKLAEFPLLYPVWAELGEAWLDRARVTRAPEDVAEARAAFERSLAVQENAVALRGLIALANYRHRFEEALAYVPRARAAWVEDTTVLAMEVEALLSLERIEDTRATLARHRPRDDDFHGRAARARLWLAEGYVADAAAEFIAVSELARPVSPALARWALVRAAAAWIDSGSPERARPLLAPLLHEAPDDVDVLVHAAEVEAGVGDPAAALAHLERALAVADDPMLHAAAAPLALAAGRTDRAEHHAEVAERELRRAIDAGEVYTQHALETMRTAWVALRPDQG
jgi:tetratricopeptide (TPR) repeat protein